jgi:flagellar M-ring protein FliF
LASAISAVTARVRALPRAGKILLATTGLCALLFGGFVLYNASHQPYALLFTQMEQDDAGAVVAKLKELKVPYRIEAGGSGIAVPEARVAELRMDLAGAGLPRGGGIGFESFDKMHLGATEFEQRVLYRRALEGELARTISSLEAVQSTRVHLVLPEKSVFVSRSEPASASILLHLRPGKSVGGAEVRGIVGLTTSAVPGLSQDHVSIVTSDGQTLKKPRVGPSDTTAGDDEQVGEQRALEAQLEDRARSMLERVVGAGHVDVRVTAEIDPGRVEHVEDHYDPARTVLRSEEQTRERTAASMDDSVAGVPGAESNLPASRAPAASPTTAASATPAAAILTGAAPPKPAAAASRGGDPFRESHTRNFEVDHVSDKRSVSPGALKRIGVAVILDGVPHDVAGVRSVVPRERAELDRLALLVKSAVGASDARGDSVTVDSVPFSLPAVVADEASPPSAAPANAMTKVPAKVAAAGAGLVVLALLGVAVRFARRRPAAIPPTVLPLAGTSVSPVLDAAEASDLRARALQRAAEDPATAALVLRFWLGASDTDAKNASA